MKRKLKILTTLLAILVISSFLSNAAAIEFSTWTPKSSMLEANRAFGSVYLNGKIYVFGGYINHAASNKVVEYDIASDTWAYKNNMSTAKMFPNVAEVDGIVYVMGGRSEVGTQAYKSNEAYDPTTGTWSPKADMPVALQACGVSVIGRKIYIIGGYATTGVVNTIYVYDPDSDTWSKKADMPTARGNIATAVLNNSIYAFGGQIHNGSITNTAKAVQVYDTVTDTWLSKNSMPGTVANSGAFVYNKKIYILGGNTAVNSSWTTQSSIQEYDPVNDSWTVVGTLPSPNHVFGLSLINNRIYIYGGGNFDTASNIEENYNSVAACNLSSIIIAPNALLRITMTTGEEKEYEMAAAQISHFIAWYGSGLNSNSIYTINKNYNLGTLASRKDILLYNKIAFFEVMSYSDKAPMAGTSDTYTTLLKVTMATGDILEYEATDSQLAAFTSWYSSGGADKPTFTINKTFNLGPFVSREVYLVFNMISDIEIIDY